VSNFVGVAADGAYVTPRSGSILPSITNKMLMALAADAGMRVEERPLPIDELPSFREVGACGTATVVAPSALRADRTRTVRVAFARPTRPAPAPVSSRPSLVRAPRAVASVTVGETTHAFGDFEVLDSLRRTLQEVQFGEREDTHKWMRQVEC
jgi:branched-chain amino acid aminotransferase